MKGATNARLVVSGCSCQFRCCMHNAEAAQLEMLEGRHPLALAHYANHPPAGSAPNAVIANFSFKLPAAGAATSPSSSDQATGRQQSQHNSSSSSSSDSAAPWLRAYVPNIDYVEECSQQHLLRTVSAATARTSLRTSPRTFSLLAAELGTHSRMSLSGACGSCCMPG
jgi:hypothetical protein